MYVFYLFLGWYTELLVLSKSIFIYIAIIIFLYTTQKVNQMFVEVGYINKQDNGERLNQVEGYNYDEHKLELSL